MAKSRFLYSNMITAASMLSVSSLKTGLISTAKKDGDGSAVIVTGGTFSGAQDLEYVIEIDGAGTGEIGSSTFKWSDDGGATWDATGVTTAHTAITLNNGVTVCWPDHGTGADFVLGDKWYFKAINLFCPGNLLLVNRDRRYRSAALSSPNTVTVDCGAAVAPTALILDDHNFTSGATIALKGHTSNSWGSPAYSQTITWASQRILHYLTGSPSYRYWQLQVTNTSNPAGYIELGKLFLGTYLELASRNIAEGWAQPLELLLEANRTPYGVGQARFYNTREAFSIDFKGLSSADADSLRTMALALGSKSTGIFKQLWFNLDSDTPAKTWVLELVDFILRHRTLAYYDVAMKVREVLTSV